MTYQCAVLEITQNIYGGYNCKIWVEVASNQASYITPEIAGYIILYSLTLNLLIAGFKAMRKVM